MNDSEDEIETCQVLPHEDDENIKSRAVVKIATNQAPSIKFRRLELKTNLNLPPSNWLCTSNTSSSQIHQAVHGTVGFASFRMAHMFADCLCDVDVVSDAENIKKLLKLSYCPEQAVSMMVHKIGNALLIDEFDIQKYLLRQADDDWNWLRTFIEETILNRLGNDIHRNVSIKNKSREAIRRKNLFSKFLYHTLQQSTDLFAISDNDIDMSKTKDRIYSLPLLGPILPEPNIEENIPDSNSNHTYNRNVIWTFEDIRMLIGTDMPIFGGGTRPCISLRLRDMTKPINILTGIDYWLDNLMCNVPEVVMCYHLDGIVQKYELIKTEDLPYLKESQFSPQVIRNVAQNILAFLKGNATKAGHTYWLFKGKNDDVVKLYDLTTLCKNTENSNCTDDHNKSSNDKSNSTNNINKHDNPFTIPVAMLLYKVARNIKNTSEKISAKKAGSIKTLLENCIKLLPKEKYPQIVTSSHYILADLYVPAGLDPKSPDFSDDLDSDTFSNYEEEYEDDEAEIGELCNANIAVKNISDTLKDLNIQNNINFNHGGSTSNRPPSPLQATLEERCKKCLHHIGEGLVCCQFFTMTDKKKRWEEEKRKIIIEEQNPNMARPFQPIPLPYETLLKTDEPKFAIPSVPIPLGWEKKISNDSLETLKSGAKKKKKKKSLNERNSHHKLISTGATETTQTISCSWDIHLKSLLLEKACLAFATLAESNYSEENYGTCLKCVDMALQTQQWFIKIVSSESKSFSALKVYLHSRAADCFFEIVKNGAKLDECCDQYKQFENEYKNFFTELNLETNEDSEYPSFNPVKNIEESMVISCKLYEKALEFASEDLKDDIMRRLGSVRNELGLKYMYCAQEEYSKFMHSSTVEEKECSNSNKKKILEPRYQILIKESFDNLTKSIAAFEKVNDTVNLAFLLCNMGRFMRFRAHIHLADEMPDDVRLRKKFYNQAFSYYKRALTILDNRKSSPELWDLVNWELSTATFTLAKEVQDHSNKYQISSEELEKEVVELLQKSLKLCDLENTGSRQILYTYRCGLIHSRLASFYHVQLRKNLSNDEHKKFLQLCRLYYEKSAKILENIKECKDFLMIQLERIALQEFLAEDSNAAQKFKILKYALELCLQSSSIFQYLSKNDMESQKDEIWKLMKLFENRLQNLLKTLTKICLIKNENNKTFNNDNANIYKKMFSTTLNIKNFDNIKDYSEHLFKVLNKLNDIKQS